MSPSPKSILILLATLTCCNQFCLPASRADGPEDNRPDQVRPIPPVGIEASAASIDALSWRCKAIRAQWNALLDQDADRPLAALASEVLVFPRAVELAIEFQQFYRPNDLQLASQLLDESTRRLETAAAGGGWGDVVGLGDGSQLQLIVGGYESKIDGSYQPYGLVLPPGLGQGDARPRRLDLWFHGRGEKLSEVAFLGKQQRDPGQYTPDDTIVLHPYGRYSNAFKFAGEVDVLEVRDYIRGRLPVDPDRISVRGFSMGGAACWQFATHYADQWFAANPGAGFSETPQFLKFFQQEDVRKSAPEYQQRLWQLYDCPTWAINLTHCPTIAYSGEIDRQRQAATVMEDALQELGIDLTHVIGPNTAHKIHPDSKIEIAARMSELARRADGDAPPRVEFATTTLRYHRMHWIDVQGLGKHWTPARVSASIEGSTIEVSTENVTRLRLAFRPGQWTGSTSGPVTVRIDGQRRVGPLVGSDRSWTWELSRRDGSWQPAKKSDALRKRPGLQGPIDDAFMDSFVFILPSGESSDESFERWAESEAAHAMLHWRKQFRGDVRVKRDTEITGSDIDSGNLVLFGDPESNKVIRLIENDLPMRWQQDSLAIGDAVVPRSGHAAVIIFPNPLNPERYVVLNSGFTFREYDYLNNARQTPKLPDWALIDIRKGATSQSPGVIKAAGFFDENWQP